MKLDESRIREQFLGIVASREFRPTLRKIYPSQLWRIILALLAFASGVGILIGVYQLFRATQLRRGARLNRLLAAITRSRLIWVDVLMANDALYKTTGAVAPALVMGSFDPDVAEDREFRHDLFMKISLLGLIDGEDESPAEIEAARMTEDQAYRPDRRRLLPLDLTEGKPVYLFDLQVIGDFRPKGKLETSSLPCLAEPGPAGQIVMIPWYLVVEELDFPET